MGVGHATRPNGFGRNLRRRIDRLVVCLAPTGTRNHGNDDDGQSSCEFQSCVVELGQEENDGGNRPTTRTTATIRAKCP